MSTLEERVAALERQVREQSSLRASQDRDLASIEQAQRAMSLSMQALAITQSEHNRKIDEISAVLNGHTTQLASIETKMRAGFAALTTLLTTLIDQGEPGDPRDGA